MDAGGPPDDGNETPGPIRLPRPTGSPAARRLGWPVATLVVLLAVVFYFGTRPPLHVRSAPQPRWGKTTLAQVARGGAKAAGEAHPRHATWMFGYRNQILAALTGHAGHGSEAEYVVVMQGTFHSPPTGGAHTAPLLPGSAARGSQLVLLVRAFDGRLRDQWLGSRVPAALGQVGIVRPLSLGGLPFGL